MAAVQLDTVRLTAMKTGSAGMARELEDAPDAVRRQEASAKAVQDLIARCRRHPPQFVVTCARGSSDNAATFAKHLIERYLGIPVAAAAPNIATVYHQRLRLKNQLLLVISQSGRSDDLAEFSRMAKSVGATTAAVVNDIASPLAEICDVILPMAAGPELSVAATKSFIAALAMLLRVTAAWREDHSLSAALDRLPDRLEQATALDWGACVDALSQANSLVTIGRGPTLAIAREAALKLKETCYLHAEAFSSAEFQHGPLSLVSPLYPIIMFMPSDAAVSTMRELAASLRAKGAALFCTDNEATIADRLPVLDSDQPDADAICLIQSFYAVVIRVAAMRGTDVDMPRHLQKITRTR
jgi:glutamine---fructose-6-phosphate transaminase (isomerizing)